MDDLTQFANLPIGAGALWIAWRLGLRALRTSEKRLEQDAAREIAERAARVAELHASREERRDERSERQAMISAVTRLTDSLEHHATLQEKVIDEIREARCKYPVTADIIPTTRGTGGRHG